MAKKKQITIKDPETRGIFGIICLALSLLLGASIFFESPIIDFIKRYFGVGVFVMTIFLFLLSLRLLGAKKKYNTPKVLFFILLFLLSLLPLVHIFADPLRSFEIANSGGFGGLIGYYLLQQLRALGLEISFILLALSTILSLLMALNISFDQIGNFLSWCFELFINIINFFVEISIKVILFFQKVIDKKKGLEVNVSIQKNEKTKKIESKNAEKSESEEVAINLSPIKMVSDISTAVKSFTESKPEVEIKIKDDKTSSENLIKKTNVQSVPLDLSLRQYPDWQLPPLDILDPIKPKQQDSKEVIERKARAIIETLNSFNIKAEILGYSIGPTVTQFFIDPAAGIKFSKIANLSKDLALTLASPSDLRIELVPGKSYIGIDVPNDIRQTTQLREAIKPIYDNPNKYTLGLAVGIDIQGNPICRDLVSAPHLLVAGATGQGKSVLVNAFIISLLMRKTPDELKFILIDPKMVEMAPYDGIPHLLTPPITDMSKASSALKWAVNEMEERYKILKEAGVRNIADYITITGKLMPYIVIIVDEFSDLMMQYRQDVETSIIRLAQKSRAVGIHLIIATQRPTADVITGLIKSNIPARIALAVASSMDSRVILDSTGAETLLGKGDLLIKTANDLKPSRVQGVFIDDKGENSEFYRILNFIKKQAPNVVYNDESILKAGVETDTINGEVMSDDPLFRQAAEIVVSAQKGSASLLQTKMKIGYARAARLIDELEMAGIVGPQDGPRPREVLISSLEALDAFFNQREEVANN